MLAKRPGAWLSLSKDITEHRIIGGRLRGNGMFDGGVHLCGDLIVETVQQSTIGQLAGNQRVARIGHRIPLASFEFLRLVAVGALVQPGMAEVAVAGDGQEAGAAMARGAG